MFPTGGAEIDKGGRMEIPKNVSAPKLAEPENAARTDIMPGITQTGYCRWANDITNIPSVSLCDDYLRKP